MSARFLGRVASTVLVLGLSLLVLLAALPPHLMHFGPVHVVDWVGLLIYLGAPVAWLSAIYHWARYFPSDGPRRRWGVAVVLGFVPGAIMYWWRGVRHTDG